MWTALTVGLACVAALEAIIIWFAGANVRKWEEIAMSWGRAHADAVRQNERLTEHLDAARRAVLLLRRLDPNPKEPSFDPAFSRLADHGLTSQYLHGTFPKHPETIQCPPTP